MAWWCYHPTQWPLNQVELVTTLLGWVAAAIPAGRKVLVQADRGIGTSPELLHAIEALGWYYLVRVQGQVRLSLEDGREIPFAQLVPKLGQRWSGWVWAFKNAGWRRSVFQPGLRWLKRGVELGGSLCWELLLISHFQHP